MRLIPALLAVAGFLAAQTPLLFTEHTLTTGLKGGYQVVVADLNHDGKPDIIALASGGLDLVWFENPNWERHVLVANLPRSINCAVGNPDAEGIPEIVVAWAFENDAAKSVGKVGLLRHDGDPRQPWKLQQIDELTTSHRLRWADIDGSGKKVAINGALTIVIWSYLFFGTSMIMFAVVRATGAVMPPLIMLVVALWLIRVPFAYSMLDRWQADAIWWSFPLASATSMLMAIAYCRYGGWRKVRLGVASLRAVPVAGT